MAALLLLTERDSIQKPSGVDLAAARCFTESNMK
jgi:hypothetical protein